MTGRVPFTRGEPDDVAGVDVGHGHAVDDRVGSPADGDQRVETPSRRPPPCRPGRWPPIVGGGGGEDNRRVVRWPPRRLGACCWSAQLVATPTTSPSSFMSRGRRSPGGGQVVVGFPASRRKALSSSGKVSVDVQEPTTCRAQLIKPRASDAISSGSATGRGVSPPHVPLEGDGAAMLGPVVIQPTTVPDVLTPSGIASPGPSRGAYWPPSRNQPVNLKAGNVISAISLAVPTMSHLGAAAVAPPPRCTAREGAGPSAPVAEPTTGAECDRCGRHPEAGSDTSDA